MTGADATSQFTVDDLREHRDEILEIAGRHGARNVRVFGSVARGDADASSDVDILVEMERGRSLLDLAGFHLDVEDLLGVRVDVVTEKGLRERIRDDVLAEAVSVRGATRPRATLGRAAAAQVRRRRERAD